jgi:putative FmdB family regulatory protein
MPIYEYQCEACGTVFDKFVRSMSTAFEVECPKCKGKECRKHITRFGTTGIGGGVAEDASCAPSG